MKTLFQINVVANSGSTGHIAEELGRLVMAGKVILLTVVGPVPANLC